MYDFISEAKDIFDYTRTLRRDFHHHPELGFQELRTSEIVARELKALGMEVATGVGKTGVVAVLEGGRPGPVALLRFDMDALPIQEETGAEYASVNPGVMHACGHDGHIAIGLSVARILHTYQANLAGTVKFIFQPAEEGLGGAEAMIAEGALENPKADFCLALHLWNERPYGWLGISPGPVMTAGELFKIRVTGKGGHGALPHLAKDPVLAAATIVTTIQSVASRNVSPLQSAVVSVTAIHGGETFNVIPPRIEMQGTIRTFEPEVRSRVTERFQEILAGVAQAMDCQVEVEITSLTPPVINERRITTEVQQIAGQLFPKFNMDKDFRTMVSEDMAFVMEEVPGCFFFVGSANSEKGLDAPHHHPKFDIEEGALEAATAFMSAATANLLVGGR